jgi:adenosine deaminase
MNQGPIPTTLLRRLPKTDLHVHLDGSLRPDTMIELASERGIELPATEPPVLAAYMRVDDARRLEDYLFRFETTLALMQDAEALERIAFELAIDAAADGVVYMEVRWCPALNTRLGLSLDEATEAPLRGFRRAESEADITTVAIVCGLRTFAPAVSLELAELAAAFRQRGVVGYDLAGAEAGSPAGAHAAAFRLARRAGLATTCHAGEGAGPESVWEALVDCGANRIGHGTRIPEDPELLRYVVDMRVPIEVCLTSNIQTHAARSYEEHPLRRFADAGVLLSLNTDNRLMSGTTVTEEFRRAHAFAGLGWDALCGIALGGFESGFLPHAERQARLSVARTAISRLGSGNELSSFED